ncbi:unnamed protein product [Lepeophtheirus salmonis]|uniref:(salmon louse) hypothetical protein n=1 Tax=Lepeophtheirus salmonis TaxID=72036 RepID=A0A0K2VAF5_LEPSM|nr:zinc finger protein Noc-like [Lepeophtheirus salmonis]CAB4055861.1 unnamed protein product [Lepeophtheirus salmonis]CAF2782438.1 unnamed protein product [Lepeophtheirus salmonis]
MTISESGTSSSSTSPPTSSSSNSMISAMNDRYITPEYLAPLPSSEKTGKSPLQLLAQTCSQIGADPMSNKLLNEKNNNSKDHSSLHHHYTSHHPPPPHHLGGHNPYDHNDLKKSSNRSPVLVVTDPKPVSFKPYENSKAPSPKVVSLSPEARSPPKVKSTRSSPASNHSATSKVSPGHTPNSSAAAAAAALPMIRSGMEILSGAKDPSSAYANPAFRPPFGVGVCRDPYCRDPSCPTAIYNAQLASALAGLPMGYAELLQAQQKFTSAMIPGFAQLHAPSSSNSSSGGGSTTTTTASSSNGPSLSSSSGPYVCNWMNGREGYCGKRHASAEELLQHLKTHTSLSAGASGGGNTESSSLQNSSLYPSLLSGGGPLHPTGRGYNSGGSNSSSTSSNSSSSSSSSRYQPYGKPSAHQAPPIQPPGIPSIFGGIPPGLAGFPPSLLSGAYSPSSLYALYGSRLAGSLP